MTSDTFFCKPQAEEYFSDAGFYKQHEAYHLLKFHDEKQILKKAYIEYNAYLPQRNKIIRSDVFLGAQNRGL